MVGFAWRTSTYRSSQSQAPRLLSCHISRRLLQLSGALAMSGQIRLFFCTVTLVYTPHLQNFQEGLLKVFSINIEISVTLNYKGIALQG
jgi:hypothetical protein